ncbi:alpha/beta fold hydrolase [Spirillospora sp. CA-294931]|uniref:alpha/beta fold hydrolase n=1 Tax=Spirillospora sp. CA-294931 TaxID=3240042 RepID=UPI003D8B883E
MPTTTSQDGTTIAFDRAGSGPALIMVDAASCFRAFGPMGPVADALADRFTVFTYDRRGRGESTDTPPYAVEREIDDLRALMAEAGGSACVFGFSSGAVLALHAAAAGLPISRLALLEPPIDLDGEPDTAMIDRITELVAAGRGGDAIEYFNTSIGVPAEMIAGLRGSPAWPALEALAHTLVYDLTITGTLSAATLAAVPAPTLVIDSSGSDDRMGAWADQVATLVPDGRRRTLKGDWHTVPAEDLAPALADFCR